MKKKPLTACLPVCVFMFMREQRPRPLHEKHDQHIATVVNAEEMLLPPPRWSAGERGRMRDDTHKRASLGISNTITHTKTAGVRT